MLVTRMSSVYIQHWILTMFYELVNIEHYIYTWTTSLHFLYGRVTQNSILGTGIMLTLILDKATNSSNSVTVYVDISNKH